MSARVVVPARKLSIEDQQRHLSPPWAMAGRAIWLALTLVAVALIVILASPVMHTWEMVCTHKPCADQQLTLAQAHQLAGHHLSLADYAHFTFSVRVTFIALFLIAAAIIMARKSRDRMAVLSAIFLVTFGGITYPGTASTLAQYYHAWQIPAGLLELLGTATATLFLYTFPTGRSVPRWGLGLVIGWTIIQLPGALFPQSLSLNVLPPQVVGIVYLVGLGIPVGAQIYRFRRVSNAVQRQQTKPVVFGLTVAIGGFLALLLSGEFLVPASVLQDVVSNLIVITAFYVFMLAIPISITVAVLRYKLWDIDALVNRTLVYVSLTASLVALYFGCVVGLQAVFRAFSGQSSNLTIAISTLVIAAAFQPLRRRIQSGIDHRFYRRKYDATKTLTAFSTHLSNEVDLEHLSREMAKVVQETMHPAHMSLWLRPTDHTRG